MRIEVSIMANAMNMRTKGDATRRSAFDCTKRICRIVRVFVLIKLSEKDLDVLSRVGIFMSNRLVFNPI